MTHLRLLASTAVVAATLISWPATSAHAAGETCDGKPATIVVTSDGSTDGTDGDDVIVVQPGVTADVHGLAGDDTICGATRTYGGPGNDDLWSGAPVTSTPTCYFFCATVDGDAGDDVIHGNDSHEALFGGDGNDTIYGNGGDDILQGDRDPLYEGDGVPGNDTLDAGTGDDTVVDSPGDDTMHGGDGYNILALSMPTDDPVDGGCAVFPGQPTVDVAAGTVTGLGTDTFDGFSRYVADGYTDATVFGTSGHDHLVAGFCGRALLYGRGGNDNLTGDSRRGGVLSGGQGNDRLAISGRYVVKAGTGNDKLRIDPGEVTDEGGSSLAGGPGTDVLLDHDIFYNRIDLRRGISDTFSDGLQSSPINIRSVENVTVPYPAYGPLIIGGTAGPNVLIGPRTDYPGQSKRAVLRGRGGNDRLVAGPHDTAYGGPGHDYCRAAHTIGCEAP